MFQKTQTLSFPYTGSLKQNGKTKVTTYHFWSTVAIHKTRINPYIC